jgi:CHASE1-domain containing sensor protein
VELATTVFVTFLCLAVFMSYHELRREGRATREELASIMRRETERLEQKVDRFVNANTTARMLADHAVARAERAETAAAKPVIVVMPPASEDDDEITHG